MKIEIDGVRHIADEFDVLPRQAQLAVVRAANRGVDAAGTLMKRLIRDDMGLKAGTVAKALKNRKASRANPTAVLGASLKRIPLVDFGARPDKPPSRGKGRGVSYKLGKGSRGRVAEAFAAKMPGSGHYGIFKRMTRGKGSKRLPIAQLYGPSIGHVFGVHRPAGNDRAIEVFTETLDHEIAWRKAATS